MTPSLPLLTVLLLASALTSFTLTGILRKYALKRNIFDKPDQPHKAHLVPVPYLGGVGIIGTVNLFVFSGLMILRIDTQTRITVLSILVPATLMGVVGLIDDIKKLSPLPRFIAQTFSGLFTAIAITSVNTVGSP